MTRVQLRFRCSNLKKMDHLSESDPFVQVFLRQRSQGDFREIGRTETLKNSPNPEFQTAVELEYSFHELQELRFVVSDSDGARSASKLIGSVETNLANILTQPGQRFVGKLTTPKASDRRGTLFVTATPFNAETARTFSICFRGEKLDKKDLLGKSDPFFVISRKEEGVVDSHAWTQVYKSETIMNTLDPAWKAFTLTDTAICGGRAHVPLRIDVFDWDRFSPPELIGSATTTLEALMGLAADRGALDLINAKKQQKGGGLFSSKYTNSGRLFIDTCTPRPGPFSLYDYLRGGLEVGVVVAIDFTGSNGDPRDWQSLHYLDRREPANLNPYQRVIAAVGSILSCYDADQLFPAFGFGAQLPTGQVSHCFPLNFNPAQPECVGIAGILDAYVRSLQSVALSGPTCFAPVIRAAAQHARTRAGPRLQYTILLIVTDGEITDQADTIDAIVESSTAALSIIIVGVGTANFDKMNVLDGDVTPLRSRRGVTCARDIVQFVAFRNFNPADPAALAAAVLEEVPRQVTQHFEKLGIAPPPPTAAPPLEAVMASISHHPSMQVGAGSSHAAAAAAAAAAIPLAPQGSVRGAPATAGSYAGPPPNAAAAAAVAAVAAQQGAFGYPPPMPPGAPYAYPAAPGMPLGYHPSMAAAPLGYHPSLASAHGPAPLAYHPSMAGATYAPGMPLGYHPSQPAPVLGYHPSQAGPPLGYHPSLPYGAYPPQPFGQAPVGLPLSAAQPYGSVAGPAPGAPPSSSSDPAGAPPPYSP